MLSNTKQYGHAMPLKLKFSISLNLYMHDLLFQTLSSWATSSVEEVSSTGPGIRFFQLYVSLRNHWHFLSIFILIIMILFSTCKWEP